MASIGTRISKIRTKRLLSLAKLAAKTNIEKSELAAYELDKKTPDEKTIQILAQALDISANYLIRGYSSEIDPVHDPSVNWHVNLGGRSWGDLSPEEEEEILDRIRDIHEYFHDKKKSMFLTMH